MSRFQHAPRITVARGSTRYQCDGCGWQGARHEHPDDARAEYDQHVGLHERPTERPGRQQVSQMGELDEVLVKSVFFPGHFH